MDEMINCKWCDSQVIEIEPPSIRPDWKRLTCSGCGSIRYTEDPSRSELQSIYESAWLDQSGNGSFAYGSTSREIADALIKIGIPENINADACLDYGSGKGLLAERLMLSRCKEVYVVEPFGPDADIPGVSWNRDWTDLPNKMRFYRIFMVEVVEHLLNPVDELRKARSKLSDNGLVLITTPNARGWRAVINRGKWRESQNPTHVNLFSYKSLKICLEKAGYTDIYRVKKTISYKKGLFSGLLLRLTQILRIDGGLRVLAR